MADVLCPACGSEDLKDEVVERTYVPPFGEECHYQLTIQRCQKCEEGGDFVGANPPIIKEVIDASDRGSARVILEAFGAAEVSMAFIERALRLPKRTLARWKTGDISAAGLALLRIVRTYPWILGVAAMGFDRDAADEALRVATEAADTSIECRQVSSVADHGAGGEVVDLKSYADQKATVNRSHAGTVPCEVAGGM